MDVFCDDDCVKYKMCMVLCFISVECHIQVKVNLKTKIMNAYFQRLLYYMYNQNMFPTPHTYYSIYGVE